MARRNGARISRLEWAAALTALLAMVGLVIAEPDILEAPFENARTVRFVVIGTLAAAIALGLMLRFGVPAPIRVVVLGVPFVAVSWWLISPYFIDDVANDDFATSIAAATGGTAPPESTPSTTASPGAGGQPAPAVTGPTSTSTQPVSTQPAGPTLLGSGRFAGLAGHEGTGDAGIFRLGDGSHVLRLENLDIQNGPDLRLYVIPGRDRRTPAEGSQYLGKLRGNVGNQTYDLAADFLPAPGDWTVLVWCEAFDVEFVGASLSIE